MKHELLLTPYHKKGLELKNRVVMAPMTRSRAIGNVPNELMAEYYAQRADAGLIVTEGTSPSPNGLGYPRIPGLYSEAQVAGWKKVTSAVHAKGGKIFVQLMHTGRVSHQLNMPEGSKVVGVSPIAAATTIMFTDQQGVQSLPVPEELSKDGIAIVIAEYAHSAKAAIEAGFDGVEIHAANGYLPEQFLNPASNRRTDEYGNTPDNRNRFVLELVDAVTKAIGSERTGIRFSLFGKFNDMAPDETSEGQYLSLAKALQDKCLAYFHFLNAGIPENVLEAFRVSGRTIILNAGYDADRAEADLEAGKADLIAFGRPFISNPGFIEKIAKGATLISPDEGTFYTPGAKGYTDYPEA